MKAIIIGATGATGKPLVEQLLADERFAQVLVFVRKPVDVTHPKLTAEVIDFEMPDTWVDKVRGDVLFSCLGTTLKQAGSQDEQYKIDVGYQYKFAKIAKDNGILHYVLVSANGANRASRLFYPRIKGELEHKVLALNFDKCTILRPPLLYRPNSDRFGETLAEKIIGVFNKRGLLLPQKPLAVDKLARAMIKAVLENKIGVIEKDEIWQMIA